MQNNSRISIPHSGVHSPNNVNIDQIIIERFGKLHKQAIQGKFYEWRFSSQGALAEIIILDQFSRNIHRDHAKSFDNDGMALVLAQNMIEKQQDKLFNSR
jgi:uncharacterized protein (DUF924 family)